MDMRLELVPLPTTDVVGRGVDVSAVSDMGGVRYAYSSDPDGNSWALQQIPADVSPPPGVRRPG